MTMGDCLRTNKLIILRGNSGSGKTTIAKELQQVFEKDYTSVLYETRITADQDRESIVRDICQNIISNGK